VRTTLKRSTGRFAAWGGDGNGHLPYPDGTAAPPPPWGPTVRYRAPRRGALRIALSVVGWILVIVLMAAGALAGGAWIYINESVQAVRPHTKEAKEAQKQLDVPVAGEPTTALVIGYDQRAGIERSAGARSDTVMLIRANPKDDTISLFSFPRDLVVDIPPCNGHSAYRSKINAAYSSCGPKGTLQTVRELTGVPINYLITVNFRAFKQVVDKVGGVYVDVDRRYFNDNSSGYDNYATINLQPGYQKLNGGRALDFVRYRHTDSDFYRIRRQQQFVTAFKERVSGLFSLTKLPGIIKAITENVEIARGGSREIDADTLLSYARFAYSLPSGNFEQVTIDPSQLSGATDVRAPQSAIDDAVRQFLNPDRHAARKATDVATRRKPKRPDAPPPSQTTVAVWNGNGVDGSAGDAAYLLGQRRYRTIVGGSMPTFDYFHTTVLYDPSAARAKQAASAVARLFGDGQVVRAKPADRLDTMLKVVVGQTFKGTLGPAVVDTIEHYHPPQVVNDPAQLLPLARKAQRQVDFKVYVPTIRGTTSYPDQVTPMRTYRLEKHDALRFVYRIGGTSDYWGVEEMHWKDAPILGGASVTRKLKNRAYRLYFNGSKLHMVAFDAKGSAYWVVNTLLDKLSNETMLSIARGLRPLRSGR
jgi:LCP family protein required for cell wall assembly